MNSPTGVTTQHGPNRASLRFVDPTVARERRDCHGLAGYFVGCMGFGLAVAFSDQFLSSPTLTVALGAALILGGTVLGALLGELGNVVLANPFSVHDRGHSTPMDGLFHPLPLLARMLLFRSEKLEHLDPVLNELADTAGEMIDRGATWGTTLFTHWTRSLACMPPVLLRRIGKVLFLLALLPSLPAIWSFLDSIL